mgnify:CR=1 FL=1
MTRKKLHIISLKEKEREDLKQYHRKDKSSARSLTRARILLLEDEGRDDEMIAELILSVVDQERHVYPAK